jgi:predicted MFS family arabinose efflux permease
VTLLALITAVAVWAWLPDIDPSTRSTAGRLNLLRRPPIRWGLVTTFGLFLAAYAVYTYLSPVVHQATGLGSTGVAALMIVFGAGGLLGGRLIGSILAKRSIAKVLRTALLLITVLLSVLTVLTAVHVTAVATIVAFPLVFAFGAAWWSGGISQQTRLAGLAPNQRPQALGLHFSSQFLGVAVGGALGGVALSAAGAVSIPVIGAVIALLTILSVRQTTPEQVSDGPPLTVATRSMPVASANPTVAR